MKGQTLRPVIVRMIEQHSHTVQSTQLYPFKRPVQTAAAIGFWATILFITVSYVGLAFYANMPLPLRLVTGTSMEPTLHAGDVIMLKALPFAHIRKGDLVAYKSPDAANARAQGRPDTILHRVIEVDENEGVLITKGDNSRVDPWPITSDIVKGKQVMRIPAIGRPLLMLTRTKGAAFVSGMVLVLSLFASTFLVYSAVAQNSKNTQHS